MKGDSGGATAGPAPIVRCAWGAPDDGTLPADAFMPRPASGWRASVPDSVSLPAMTPIADRAAEAWRSATSAILARPSRMVTSCVRGAVAPARGRVRATSRIAYPTATHVSYSSSRSTSCHAGPRSRVPAFTRCASSASAHRRRLAAIPVKTSASTLASGLMARHNSKGLPAVRNFERARRGWRWLTERHVIGASSVPLTRRQREVVELLAQGQTNREIARALFISERTAEGHVQQLCNLLGVSTRTHVALWWAGQQAAAPRPSPPAPAWTDRLDRSVTNLPLSLTTFVRRQRELAELPALRAAHRP